MKKAPIVFTSSDGKQFTDRNEWRKYEFETNYTFRNRSNETLMKLPGKISGQPFDLSDLTDCQVLLLDQCDQVQVDNLTNCRVFIGPCSESVFVRNCTNCTFTIACKQLRTRDCSQCNIHLYSLTDPIIETSKQMRFAPFNGAYHGIKSHFDAAHLEPNNNHWSQIFDFNDPDKTGANWSLMKKTDEGEPWVVTLDQHMPDASALGPCENPVKYDAAFIQYPESESGAGKSGAMKSFSFNTSQKQAEQVIQTQHQTTAAATVPAVPTAPQALSPGTAPLPTMPVPPVGTTEGSGQVPGPPAAPMMKAKLQGKLQPLGDPLAKSSTTAATNPPTTTTAAASHEATKVVVNPVEEEVTRMTDQLRNADVAST